MLQGVLVSSAFGNLAARASEQTSLLTDSALNNAVNKSPRAICDPTVESYKKGTNVIHIVGTAHISSVSSRLSGAVVREMKVESLLD